MFGKLGNVVSDRVECAQIPPEDLFEETTRRVP